MKMMKFVNQSENTPQNKGKAFEIADFLIESGTEEEYKQSESSIGSGMSKVYSSNKNTTEILDDETPKTKTVKRNHPLTRKNTFKNITKHMFAHDE